MQPFARCLPPLASAQELTSIIEGSADELHVTASAQSYLQPVWQLLQTSISEKRLITIHFGTVFEYLAYLETVAAALKVWCPNTLTCTVVCS
jgi:hypothetical protein